MLFRSSSLSFTGAAIPAYPANFTSQPSTGTLARPSILLFDKGYVLPLTMQGSLGVEYEIASHTTIGISYLNVRGEHLSRTRDVNLYPEQPVSVNLPGLGTRTLYRHPGLVQGSPFRPLANFVRVEVFESGADSFYNGMILTFKRRFGARYTIGLSYTWAKVIDTVPEFTSVVPFNGIDEVKNTQYGLSPNADRGPGGMDQRHRVVTNFLWDLDYFRSLKNPVLRYLIGGWQLSGIITAQSGQPYSNAMGGDPNSDSNGFTDRVPGDGRNTNYAPSLATWDLRVTKSIPIYERVKLNLGLDAFNALNQAPFVASNIRNGKYNFSATGNTFTPTTNFGTYANQTLDNRVLQVSAKIVF